VFKPIVPRRRLNRREALGLGAAALAGGALRPRSALAAGTSLFELAIEDGGAHVAGWRTTAVLHAPRRFDLIGLRWARGGHLDAQVRARRRGGGWTPWMALHPSGDHAPDGARAPAGTEPAYTGAADVFQLRLRGSARAVRARFVRAQPTARAARHVTGRLRRRRRRPAAHASQSSQPAMRFRSEWGGDSVPPRAAPEYGEVQAAFVHHTVNANDYGPDESPGIVLGIARYHRDSNGWNDIGYNFLVDRYGQIFEGRAGGIDQPVIGAQAQGYNSSSTGIACIGTFTGEPQTDPGIESLARLIGWKLSLHAVPTQGTVTVTSRGGPTNRYPSGTPVTIERISGHRDGDQTSCPGDALYAQLPDLRIRASRYAGPLAGITVHAARTRVRSGPVQLSGRLAFPDGSSPAGAPLDIEFAVPGAAFTRIAGTVCGPDGSWAATVPLTVSGLLRAAFAGDATRPPLASSPVAIRVLPLLRLGLSSRRVRRGHNVAVSGTVSPRPATGRVEVRLERRVGRRWLRVQRKRINVRGGRYLTKVRLRRAGLYRVSVLVPGATKRLQVRAR
jgi:N-acetylmuramoyl-L-alanine amidase